MMVFVLLMMGLGAEPWPHHTDAELKTEISAACVRATAAKKPVLLSFSAPWCVDCQVLHKLERDPAVQAELTNWEQVSTDVGQFDQHQTLLKALGGDRIAWWAALAPTADQCTADAATWPRLKVGPIEPATSGQFQTAADVVGWLQTARAGR